MADKSWPRTPDDPIPLPGNELRVSREAAQTITQMPKRGQPNSAQRGARFARIRCRVRRCMLRRRAVSETLRLHIS